MKHIIGKVYEVNKDSINSLIEQLEDATESNDFYLDLLDDSCTALEEAGYNAMVNYIKREVSVRIRK